MKFFRNHLIAMLIMAVSGFVALIVGIIVGLNSGWVAGGLTFIVIAAAGSLIGFVVAIVNFMKGAKTMRSEFERL